MKIRKLKLAIKKLPILGKSLTIINKRFFIKKYDPYDSPSKWLNKLLRGEKVKIVQIGSNDGATGDPIYDLIKTNKNWEVVFVEPVSYLFKRLKNNYGSESRFSFCNVAINAGSDQIFYSVKEEAKTDLPNLPIWYDQLGSFNKENILKHLDGVLEPYIEETVVEGLTLDKLFKQNQIENLSLLHIDTEGYDWIILSQLDLSIIKPELILVEHRHLSKTEKRSLINFLKPDYLLFGLGGDILGVEKNHTYINDISGLKGTLLP